MANLVKAVLSFDDGSTQEFDAASTPAPVTDTEVKVEHSDGSESVFTPEAPAA